MKSFEIPRFYKYPTPSDRLSTKKSYILRTFFILPRTRGLLTCDYWPLFMPHKLYGFRLKQLYCICFAFRTSCRLCVWSTGDLRSHFCLFNRFNCLFYRLLPPLCRLFDSSCCLPHHRNVHRSAIKLSSNQNNRIWLTGWKDQPEMMKNAKKIRWASFRKPGGIFDSIEKVPKMVKEKFFFERSCQTF